MTPAARNEINFLAGIQPLVETEALGAYLLGAQRALDWMDAKGPPPSEIVLSALGASVVRLQ